MEKGKEGISHEEEVLIMSVYVSKINWTYMKVQPIL